MTKSGQNILLVVQRASDYNEAYRAIQYLNARGCRCKVYFCGTGTSAVDNISIQQIRTAFQEKKIDAAVIKTLTVRRLRNIAIKNKIISKILIRVINKFLNLFWKINSLINPLQEDMARIFYLYQRNLRLFRNFFRRNNIDIIILCEDVVGVVTPLMIKAGHEFNIPSLIIPYTIANQEEAFQTLKGMDNYSTKRYANKIVGFFFRSWMRKDKQHTIVRLPAPYILGQVFTRTSPPDPWMMNSGYANAIAVENESMLNYYLEAGISKNKMHVVGSFSDDHLAKYYNHRDLEIEKLGLELSIDIKKPILLIGGCPNQLSGAMPPGFDFENTEQMVEFICECLQPLSEQYQFIFRPHPNFLELSDLFEKRNFVVTAIDTARLVALSNIYIAFASATIRWAIACGIPVINYDVFHYNFGDYKNIEGVINVTSKHEFEAAIACLHSDHYYMELQQAISKEKNKWGILDGKSGDRIYQLIEKLCSLDRVPRTAG